MVQYSGKKKQELSSFRVDRKCFFCCADVGGTARIRSVKITGIKQYLRTAERLVVLSSISSMQNILGKQRFSSIDVPQSCWKDCGTITILLIHRRQVQDCGHVRSNCVGIYMQALQHAHAQDIIKKKRIETRVSILKMKRKPSLESTLRGTRTRPDLSAGFSTTCWLPRAWGLYKWHPVACPWFHPTAGAA